MSFFPGNSGEIWCVFNPLAMRVPTMINDGLLMKHPQMVRQ